MKKKLAFWGSILLVLLSWPCLLYAQQAGDQVVRIPYAEGKSIYGVLSVPSDEQKRHGIVIISHGFNSSHHFGRDYFQTLNELGYAVYSFDFPCGAVHSQTDNNTLNMSVTDEKLAVETIVAYFRKQKDIDRHNIVLMGESQGGLVSALAAAELRKKISALVLIYPALCIPDDWNARYPREEDIPEVTDLWGVKLGSKYMLDIRPVKVFDILPKYTGNVLIVHGSDDPVVPLRYSERAQQTYRHSTLKVIDHAGHGFNAAEAQQSKRYVREFLTALFMKR